MRALNTVRRGVYSGDGVTLSGLEAGPADGPLVILLHGFPEDAQSWRRQIDDLATAGLRVLALDQRGYADSGRPAGQGAYHIDHLASDVAAVATSLGHDRFDLVGHDWGGVVAWWLAMRRPERLRKLVILNAPNPGAMAKYLRRSPAQLLRSAYIGLFQLPAVPEFLLGVGRSAILAGVLRRSSRRGAFSEDELDRLRAQWRIPGAMTAMLNWYRTLKPARRSSGASRRHRIAAPTLILWGAQDRFLGRGLAQASADLCERAEVRILEDATHWLHHEQAEVIDAAIVRFLRAS